jgi:2-hydroxychromene-2-carboxylate isomerase
MAAPHAIRFYFSFRSPYAWFAAERIEQELAGFEYALEMVPIYPTAETFPNDPVRTPNKLRYVMIETMRLAAEYGLEHRFGAAPDTDWAKAHAAFLGAMELGAGLRFMREMFRARFSRAQDLANDDVIAEAAERSELPVSAIMEAARSPVLQAVVANNFAAGQQRDLIFGVPTFLYNGQIFWGHDRLRSLRRAMLATA